MPVKSLWHWLREEVTCFPCHATSQELIDVVAQFQDKINQTPFERADRLWVKDSLDPDVEKLRILWWLWFKERRLVNCPRNCAPLPEGTMFFQRHGVGEPR